MLARSFVAMALASLAVSVSGAAVDRPVSPADHGIPYLAQKPLAPAHTTDASTILSAVTTVDQKTGAGVDEIPDQPIVETVVTGKNGRLTGLKRGNRRFRKKGAAKEVVAPITTTTTTTTEVKREPAKRAVIDDYRLVFSGTGTARTDRDASVQGSAYLTFTLVSNATYNVDACLEFCSSVNGCAFANLYYEFNNYGLDFEAREKSNLKCVVYGDVHSAAAKTNWGQQQSYPAPAPLIYIQHSSGWAKKTLEEPGVPEGYELVYSGDKANVAPGYLGYVLLDKYDTTACARQCNSFASDPAGGRCQFFNIWRAVVSGVPTTYTCALYFAPTDASTATFPGEGSTQVTYSRGYRRINHIANAGFEAPTECADEEFCFTDVADNWTATSSEFGLFDASFFYASLYARPAAVASLPASHAVALLGSAIGSDDLPGTLTYTGPLETVAGKTYKVVFWQNSAYSGPTWQKDAWFEVVWNGQVVRTWRDGYSAGWKEVEVEVVALGRGQDVLQIRGGAAPAWTFIDDVSVWLA